MTSPPSPRDKSGIDTQIALLRGVNVGKAKRVAMADLRSLLTTLGYRDVRTLLNSGNVIYTGDGGPPSVAADRIEKAVTESLNVKSRILVLTATELGRIVSENPLVDLATNPSRFFVSFLYDLADAARIEPLAKKDWSPESLAIGRGAVYHWCPDGILQSPLADSVGRTLRDAVTTRNWGTVLKLNALANGD